MKQLHDNLPWTSLSLARISSSTEPEIHLTSFYYRLDSILGSLSAVHMLISYTCVNNMPPMVAIANFLPIWFRRSLLEF